MKVLIAVESVPLLQVIEHLLRNRSDLETIAAPGNARGLAVQAASLLPEVILVSTRLPGSEACKTFAAVKRASPGSKVIALATIDGLENDARRCGADACLEVEALVRRLAVTVRRLSPSRASKSSSSRKSKSRSLIPNSR